MAKTAISLGYRSATGETVLEAYPVKKVVGVVHNNYCHAIFHLVEVWDFVLSAMLAVEDTNDIALLRRTKEAQAVLKWRNSNL